MRFRNRRVSQARFLLPAKRSATVAQRENRTNSNVARAPKRGWGKSRTTGRTSCAMSHPGSYLTERPRSLILQRRKRFLHRDAVRFQSCVVGWVCGFRLGEARAPRGNALRHDLVTIFRFQRLPTRTTLQVDCD